MWPAVNLVDADGALFAFGRRGHRLAARRLPIKDARPRPSRPLQGYWHRSPPRLKGCRAWTSSLKWGRQVCMAAIKLP